jgi:hypothetical protein
MNKRRITAILGASMLTLSVVTVALAIEVKTEHRGITVSWDENGDPVITGGFSNSTECEAPGEGEVIFHFVQSGQGLAPNAGGEAANTIDVDFDDEADVTGWPADDVKDNNVDWFVPVDASDGSVTMKTANSNVAGGELRVSHICVGDAPGDEETPPPTTPPTTPPTATPFQSVGQETDAPTATPFQSVEGDTDAPTEPNTATVGGSNTTGAPGDGAWLLVVALGVLLASIVVLTPARAKAPRR